MALTGSRLIYAICQEARWIFFDDDSSSSSEEVVEETGPEKEVEEPEKRSKEIRKSDDVAEESEDEIKSKKRKKCAQRITNFYRDVVPTYSLSDFQKNFRMTRRTLEVLRSTLSDAIPDTRHTGRPPIASDEKLLMTLWFLGSREAYRSVSDRFKVSTHTLFSSVMETCKVLHALSSSLISWPDDVRRNAIVRCVRERTGFTGVVGAIDGTHIRIKAPRDHPALYVNGSEFHSIILQAVCDHEMLFTSCYAGECGSARDADVFSRSPLSRETRAKSTTMFPDDTHLVGDGSYDISPYLMTPYRDNEILTRKQRTYNSCHSMARRVIRQAFAHLRGRWRRIGFLDMSRMDLVPVVVVACCVLHNLCVGNGDVLSDVQFVEEEEPDSYNDNLNHQHTEHNLLNAGKIKRDLILNNFAFYEQPKT